MKVFIVTMWQDDILGIFSTEKTAKSFRKCMVEVQLELDAKMGTIREDLDEVDQLLNVYEYNVDSPSAWAGKTVKSAFDKLIGE